MPSVDNHEDEGLPRVPDVKMAELKYRLYTALQTTALKEQLIERIQELKAAPFYEECCKDLSWTVDSTFLASMKAANEQKLKELDVATKDAEENQGDSEVRECLLNKAAYFAQIGDKEAALHQFRLVEDKNGTTGMRLDTVFYLLRIGIFYWDTDIISRNLEKAQSLIDEGGDWDRRNRLKVYRGVYNMACRNFKGAAETFLESVATFTSYELMTYQELVKYTVICSMIALDRPQLREKVVKGPEINEILFNSPKVKDFMLSFFNCQYGQFFQLLAGVEQEMKFDRYLAPHYRHYVREMRILAYNQLLQSYQSLTIAYMADAFGVSEDFIDEELSRFIAAGRLHCKIDKVNGIVETNRPDAKNLQYQDVIKEGDVLLNRIQKLSTVIHI